MSTRKVSWSPAKYANRNKNIAFVPNGRVGQLRHKNFMTKGPSANFGLQWYTKTGYNPMATSPGGVQIQNPNPVVLEPNEPFTAMPTGWYPKEYRKPISGSSPNNVRSFVPPAFNAGIPASLLVMSPYVPKPTDPKPGNTMKIPYKKGATRRLPKRTRRVKKN